MAFPFTLTGEIPLEQRPQSQEPLLAALEAEFERLHPTQMERAGNTIRFTGGIFRAVGSWNLLVPIDHGSVSLDVRPYGATLVYRLRFVQLFVITSVMIAFMAPVSLLTHASASPSDNVGILVLMWLWLFGGNLAITAARFPAFLRRVINSGRLTCA